jgi:hypothetical protein
MSARRRPRRTPVPAGLVRTEQSQPAVGGGDAVGVWLTSVFRPAPEVARSAQVFFSRDWQPAI